ncbi:hypothetical protein IAD21_04870 [Abditibacteriota bacterium]|nr:hypothetical protein IAD21_04870 [Abditibacteriota bacterium]
MKFSHIFSLICPLFVATVVSAQTKVTPQPILNRQPEKPAWEIDLTDRLQQIADGSPTSLNSPKFTPISQTFSRANRRRTLPTPGLGFWFRVPVALPATAKTDWPVVVEWDEGRLISDVAFDGEKLKGPDEIGNKWVGGERNCILPLVGAHKNGVLSFRAQWLDQLYDNGFGRLRLRPATFQEAISLDRDDNGPFVSNRSSLPFTVRVSFKAEDYFQSPLGSAERTITVGPNERKQVNWPDEVRGDKLGRTAYKTIVTAQTAGRTSPPYWWIWGDTNLENRTRPETWHRRLDWQWHAAPDGLDKPIPTDAWQDGTPNREKIGKDLPAAWLRTTIEVPADWKSPRARLWFETFGSCATLIADGQNIGTFYGWQTPLAVTLPPSARPGAKISLVMAMTSGDGRLPGQSTRGDISPTGNDQVPGVGYTELIGVEAVRTDWTRVETKTIGGKSFNTRFEFANSTDAPASVTPVITVLDHGTPVVTKTLPTVSIPAQSTINGESGAVDVPEAKLWSPETPNLYEFRTELKNEAGQTIDVRRDRFGFRQFGRIGRNFALNGEAVHWVGATHSVVFGDSAWPAKPNYDRMMRYYYPGENGFMCGPMGLNFSEELGIPMKIEDGGMNALHRETYGFQDERLWQRMEEHLRRFDYNLSNRAGLLILDQGNELNFSRPGETERMGKAYQAFRAYDPTRLVTNSGGIPNYILGADIFDRHGFPDYDGRSDWFRYHPDERPGYEKAAQTGQYWVRPKDMTANSKIQVVDDQAPFYSESYYYEQALNPSLNGPSGYIGLDNSRSDSSVHQINGVSLRRQMAQNLRVAGSSLSIIHVDRGVGRWVQPLMAASIDRRTRFVNGAPLETTWRVFHDLSGSRRVSAKFQLFDGEKLLGSKEFSGVLGGYAFTDVPLDFKLPTSTQDKEYRLHSEVSADGYDGYFRDDVTISGFAPQTYALPVGQKLLVFDPVGFTSKFLTQNKVPFSPVAKIAYWTPTANNTLLIGSEALAKTDASQLPILRAKVNDGGRVIVLDHRSLPSFLNRRFVQADGHSALAYSTGPSVVTNGLVTRDFQYWNTLDHDWISQWNSLELPSSGLTRIYVRSENAAVLEAAEGAGRVLFCQLNLRAALGVEPAANRVFANLLAWTGAPSPFAAPLASPVTLVSAQLKPATKAPVSNPGSTLIVFADPKRIVALCARMGLEGIVTDAPTVAQISAAKLVVLDGSDANIRAKMSAPDVKSALKTAIGNGVNLFVQTPDDDTLDWVNGLAGMQIKREEWAGNRAYLTGYSPITAGLTHDSLFVNDNNLFGGVDGVQTLFKPDGKGNENLAYYRLSGSGFKALTNPAYVGEIAQGKGTIVLNETRNLDYSVRKMAIVFTTLIENLGGRFTADGIQSNAVEQRWAFSPIPLDKFVNWPLKDDPAGRRGWHQQGADKDFRMFPKGLQNLKGVDYQLVDPDKLNDNGVIALADTVNADVHPREVKGIPVHRKADRLYFLHTSAWGVPHFTYRVYFTKARKEWIPGMPNPYIDVEVKDENIGDQWGVEKYSNGDAFKGGATVAWSGQNAGAKGYGVQVGVWQMIWDNPRPEDEIESIDILSPGTSGSGEVFVFAITAANRVEGGAAGSGFPKPALTTLLPSNIKPDQVLEQWQNDRYGVVVLKDGSIPVLYKADGSPLVRMNGWSWEKGDKKVNSWTNDPVVTASTSKDGNRIYEIKNGNNDALSWTQKTILRPYGVRVEYSWTPKQSIDPAPSMWLDVKSLQPLVNDIGAPLVYPIEALTEKGAITVGFDKRLFRWYTGYGVWGDDKSRVWFNPAAWVDWKTGQPLSFWLEVGV